MIFMIEEVWRNTSKIININLKPSLHDQLLSLSVYTIFGGAVSGTMVVSVESELLNILTYILTEIAKSTEFWSSVLAQILEANHFIQHGAK